MKFVRPHKSLMLGTLLCVAAGVFAQQVVYPAKGQTADQQKKDESECYTWAVQQTGFDPSVPEGGVPESQGAARRDDYLRAITACLEARGYTVR